ncbi:hypothetical protein J2Y66_003067 [Paenarthrobacter nitroguajacolicus]|nr:hypothetical protein [Paenarthrobacter nitroguajacolicus]
MRSPRSGWYEPLEPGSGTSHKVATPPALDAIRCPNPYVSPKMYLEFIGITGHRNQAEGFFLVTVPLAQDLAQSIEDAPRTRFGRPSRLGTRTHQLQSPIALCFSQASIDALIMMCALRADMGCWSRRGVPEQCRSSYSDALNLRDVGDHKLQLTSSGRYLGSIRPPRRTLWSVREDRAGARQR